MRQFLPILMLASGLMACAGEDGATSDNAAPAAESPTPPSMPPAPGTTVPDGSVPQEQGTPALPPATGQSPDATRPPG